MEDPSTQRWVLSEMCARHTSPVFLLVNICKYPRAFYLRKETAGYLIFDCPGSLTVMDSFTISKQGNYRLIFPLCIQNDWLLLHSLYTEKSNTTENRGSSFSLSDTTNQ